MGIRELQDSDKFFHVVCTKSMEARAYAENLCFGKASNIQRVSSNSDLKEMIVEFATPPFFADDWFGSVNYTKAMYKTLSDSKKLMQEGFGIYLFFTENYYEYKALVNMLPKSHTNAVYLSSLSKKDITYILGSTVSKIPDDMVKYLANNYSRNIDAIFRIRDSLQNDKPIITKNYIGNICGSPDVDINKLVISLLNWRMLAEDKYKTKTYEEYMKSVERSIKPKLQSCLDVAMEYSPQYLYVSLVRNVGQMYDLKQLFITNKIYTYKDLGSLEGVRGFDITKYSRLDRYFNKIIEVPLVYLMDLYAKLTEKPAWVSTENIFEFIYDYFGLDASKYVVNNV